MIESRFYKTHQHWEAQCDQCPWQAFIPAKSDRDVSELDRHVSFHEERCK